MRGIECGLLISELLGDKYHLHSCTVCFFGWWYLPQVYEQYTIGFVLSKLFVCLLVGVAPVQLHY